MLGSCWLICDLPEKVPVQTLTAEMNRILTWVEALKPIPSDTHVRFENYTFDSEDIDKIIDSKDEIIEEWREILQWAQKFPEATLSNV